MRNKIKKTTLAQAALQAALTAIKHNEQIRSFYQRLKQAQKMLEIVHNTLKNDWMFKDFNNWMLK